MAKITSISTPTLRRLRKALRAYETTPRRPRLERGYHASSILLPLRVKLTEDIARGESGIANIMAAYDDSDPQVAGAEITDEDQQLTVWNDYRHKLWNDTECVVMPVRGVLAVVMADAASRIIGTTSNSGTGSATISSPVGLDGTYRPGGSSVSAANPHAFDFDTSAVVRAEWNENAEAWQVYQVDCPA